MPGKFIGSGRHKEGGFLATHKQDFNAHANGTDFRHIADNIDLSSPINIFNTPSGTNVQESLVSIANWVSSIGQGFITIGDGYESGDYTVGDPGIPTLEAAFTTAFANDRLQNGGIILVKAGTYILNQSVQVPPGIIIMGEGAGTVIIGQMSEDPMFVFLPAANMFPIHPGDADMAQPAHQSGLANISLYDNLNGAIAAGNPSMSSVPMISCRRGSNVVINNCTIIGRAQESPVTVTHRGIGYTGASTGTPTILHVNKCYFDGIKTAIDFNNIEGEKDYLTVKNTRARTYGDGGLGDINDRAFVAFSPCNASFDSNFHEGLNDTWGAECCYLIKDVVVSLDNISISVVGNLGKILGASVSSLNDNNFILDNRSIQTSLRIVTSGNSWGNYNDLEDSLNDILSPLISDISDNQDDILVLQSQVNNLPVLDSGSFNPALLAHNGFLGIGSGAESAYYQRIGNIVYFTINFSATVTSGGVLPRLIEITNLPVPVENNAIPSFTKGSAIIFASSNNNTEITHCIVNYDSSTKTMNIVGKSGTPIGPSVIHVSCMYSIT